MPNFKLPSIVDPKNLGLDVTMLERDLDRAKAQVFLNSNAAFFGPLMASMPIIWTTDIPRAGTDYLSIFINPHWFFTISPKVRKFVLMHELHHSARLHNVRRGTRDAQMWNGACDLRINNDLAAEGYVWEDEDVWADPSIDIPTKLSEEEIYEKLMDGRITLPIDWDGDVIEDDDPATRDRQVMQNVVTSVHNAHRSGQPGSIPGNTELVINKFLNPIIKWEILLGRFFEDLLEENYKWAKPNRRYLPHSIYMPSRYEDAGRLQHLLYCQDVSGSITDADILRFNSELKHIKDKFNPVQLTVLQFDTQITRIDEFYEEDAFDSIKLVGRGGTSLHEVHDYIEKHKPTAAVIFSDLLCTPMAPLSVPIPIIWVVCNNTRASIPFGTKIHIKT